MVCALSSSAHCCTELVVAQTSGATTRWAGRISDLPLTRSSLISSRNNAFVCSDSPVASVSRSRSATAASACGSKLLPGSASCAASACSCSWSVSSFVWRLASRVLELAGFEVAVLERLVVAVEGALGAADLLGDRALLRLDRGPIRRLLTVGPLERVGDQVAVAVEAGEL